MNTSHLKFPYPVCFDTISNNINFTFSTITGNFKSLGFTQAEWQTGISLTSHATVKHLVPMNDFNLQECQIARGNHLAKFNDSRYRLVAQHCDVDRSTLVQYAWHGTKGK